MTVYITKLNHYKNRYFTQWYSDEGHPFSQWHETIKDIHEYFDRYHPHYIRTNF